MNHSSSDEHSSDEILVKNKKFLKCKKGERGPKGDRGDRGQQGERGERGYDGKRGPRGEKGKRGHRGKSLIWKGQWNPNEHYEENDIVQYNGSTYIAINTNCNIIPGLDDTYWDLFVACGINGTDGTNGINGSDGINGTNGTDGINGINGINGTSFIWKGPWSNAIIYIINDVVEHNGSSYIAISGNINLPPPSISWNLMAAKGENESS